MHFSRSGIEFYVLYNTETYNSVCLRLKTIILRQTTTITINVPLKSFGTIKKLNKEKSYLHCPMTLSEIDFNRSQLYSNKNYCNVIVATKNEFEVGH